jgi:hypothetical protein
LWIVGFEIEIFFIQTDGKIVISAKNVKDLLTALAEGRFQKLDLNL